MTTSNPIDATASEIQMFDPVRTFSERLTASRSNITLATTAPAQPPMVCATAYRAVSFQLPSPNNVPTIPTIGLNDAPETGAKMRINATSAPPVATALHSNCNATSCVNRSAMMPEPMTATINSPVPNASAVNRRIKSNMLIPLLHLP